MTVEIRTSPAGLIELRKNPDLPPALTGYASIYMRTSQNLGGFVEQVAPGTFDKSLADKVPVMARYNHDDNFLLGTTESGTLALRSDVTGLGYTVELPDTSTGRDLQVLAARGDLRYSSFAFQTISDEWGLTDAGFPLRTLTGVQLVDVAPVNNPAYRDATVGLRSLSERVGLPVAKLNADHLETIRAALKTKGRTVIDLKGSKRADPATSTDTEGDPDDDPNQLLCALDAVIDSAGMAFSKVDKASQTPNVQQGMDLVTAAEGLVDQLMELAGLVDPDDLPGYTRAAFDKSTHRGQSDTHPLLDARKRRLTLQQ